MNPNRTRMKGGPRRRGYTLLEVAVSVVVFSTAMGVSVKVLGWLGAERRASDRRQYAVQAASNVLERASALPFDRVTAEAVRESARAVSAERALPGAVWEVDVADDDGATVPGRRVSVRLRWTERSGGLDAPVRLSAWVYRGGASR